MCSSQGSYDGEAEMVEDEEVVSPANLKSVNLLVTFLEYIRNRQDFYSTFHFIRISHC
jgi:hypothetical protein